MGNVKKNITTSTNNSSCNNQSTAKLTIGNEHYDLPIVCGTENEKAVDMSNLRDISGYITLDIGYKNTGSTQSAITYLDGERGILRYRGYPIEQLAEKSSFLEVVYLLIHGELPSKSELDTFEERIKKHDLVHEDYKKILDGFPSTAHPMGMIASIVGAMPAFYTQEEEVNLSHSGKYELELDIIRLIAKMPAFVAWTYKKKKGHPVVYPSYKLNYVENFLHMYFSTPSKPYELNPTVVKAIDSLFILHADHEQNCSTSTVRIVGSSHANLFTSISAGICALWGSRHGGANQAVIEMLSEIKENGGSINKYLEKAKDKNDPFRLMGFGHRVYKNFDPRAKIIKDKCDKILKSLDIKDPLLDIAKQLEEAATKDSYFVERKLYPNVDFYSGIILKAVGIPTDAFTTMFVLGRLPGWIAQWKEMIDNKEPIGRPRQIYVGNTLRNYNK